MIGNNIKRLRTEQNMTQKNLADKLFVSAQAVSRWENNEVEPSIGTITELAKIFGVSTDSLLGVDTPSEAPAEPEVIVEKEYVYRETPKQMLALCGKCNSPIYDKSDIVRRFENNIVCKNCDTIEKEAATQKNIKTSRKKRIQSFIFGGIAFTLLFLFFITGSGGDFGTIAVGFFIALSLFSFISCCILKNNFIGDMSLEIISWSFVTFPGLIISLDLDGIIWFLTVKLAFLCIAIVLALIFSILAVIVGSFVSLFVYPFAIIKNFRHPELLND